MAVYKHSTLRRVIDPGTDPQQRGLARAIMTDDPETVAVFEHEGNIIKGTDDDPFLMKPFASNQASRCALEHTTEGLMGAVDRKIYGYVFKNEGCHGLLIRANTPVGDEIGYRSSRSAPNP